MRGRCLNPMNSGENLLGIELVICKHSVMTTRMTADKYCPLPIG